MTQSDLYIRGSQSQLECIKTMVLTLAERLGCQIEDETALNIPMGSFMQLLVGDSMHLGLVVGMLTDAPECVVMRVETRNVEELYDAMLKCFAGIEIEVDEDVADVPWPFE